MAVFVAENTRCVNSGFAALFYENNFKNILHTNSDNDIYAACLAADWCGEL